MTKELTVQERASQALTIEHTEEQLAEMAGKTSDVVEIKDDTDYQLVKRAALELRDVRVQIEHAGKAARDDANKFSKAVIAEERRLTGIIVPEETRLKDLRRVVDQEEERKAEEERTREMNRIVDIERRITAIGHLAEGLLNANSSDIKARLEAVEEIVTTEEYFEEYYLQASAMRENTAEALAAALVARVDLEAQQAQQARVAAEQAERQAELDRQAAELLARETAALKAEEEKNRERMEKERQEAAKKLEAERKQAEEDRAERERLEEIQRQQEAREAREQEAERQQALRPAKVKLMAWAEQIKTMEGPKGIRGKNQQKIVADALAGLGEIGNQIHAAVKAL